MSLNISTGTNFCKNNQSPLSETFYCSNVQFWHCQSKISHNLLGKKVHFPIHRNIYIFLRHLHLNGFHDTFLTILSLRDLRVKKYKTRHENFEDACLEDIKEMVPKKLTMTLTIWFATEEYCYMVALNCLCWEVKFCLIK